MPIIKSAKKRVKVANKATIRNRKTKRSLKSAIKALQNSLASDKKGADKLLADAHREIDKAIKKGVLHKNKGARKKARLASLTKEAGVKSSKTSAKKSPAKTDEKPASKKATPKPTSKKSTTKKLSDKK